MIMKNRKTREKELHASLAHEYDEHREGTRTGRYYSKEWLRAILRQIDISGVQSILDIGCGTGILYEVLQEEGFTGAYVGTDISHEMLEVGRKRYPGINVQVMDCEKLAFADRTFDVVFMRSVLHHVSKPINAIKEMCRVSKKHILISEPLRNALTKVPRYLSKTFTNHFDKDHTHYSAGQMRDLLCRGGITDYRFVHFGYFAYPFAFTDIVPGAKYLPLFLLKGMFHLDLVLSKIPFVKKWSWHLVAVCSTSN